MKFSKLLFILITCISSSAFSMELYVDEQGYKIKRESSTSIARTSTIHLRPKSPTKPAKFVIEQSEDHNKSVVQANTRFSHGLTAPQWTNALPSVLWRMVMGYCDNMPKVIFDLIPQSIITIKENHYSQGYSKWFSPNNEKYLFWNTESKRFQIFGVATEKILGELPAGIGKAYEKTSEELFPRSKRVEPYDFVLKQYLLPMWAPDGSLIAHYDFQGALNIYDGTTGKEVASIPHIINPNDLLAPNTFFDKHALGRFLAQWSNDSKKIAAITTERRVSITDLTNRKEISSHVSQQPLQAYSITILWTHNNSQLILRANTEFSSMDHPGDSHFITFDAGSLQETGRFALDVSLCSEDSLSLSPTNRYLAIHHVNRKSHERLITIHDYTTRKRICSFDIGAPELHGYNAPIKFAWSRNEKYLAAQLPGDISYVLDVAANREIGRLDLGSLRQTFKDLPPYCSSFVVNPSWKTDTIVTLSYGQNKQLCFECDIQHIMDFREKKISIQQFIYLHLIEAYIKKNPGHSAHLSDIASQSDWLTLQDLQEACRWEKLPTNALKIMNFYNAGKPNKVDFNDQLQDALRESEFKTALETIAKHSYLKDFFDKDLHLSDPMIKALIADYISQNNITVQLKTPKDLPPLQPRGLAACLPFLASNERWKPFYPPINQLKFENHVGFENNQSKLKGSKLVAMANNTGIGFRSLGCCGGYGNIPVGKGPNFTLTWDLASGECTVNHTGSHDDVDQTTCSQFDDVQQTVNRGNNIEIRPDGSLPPRDESTDHLLFAQVKTEPKEYRYDGQRMIKYGKEHVINLTIPANLMYQSMLLGKPLIELNFKDKREKELAAQRKAKPSGLSQLPAQ